MDLQHLQYTLGEVEHLAIMEDGIILEGVAQALAEMVLVEIIMIIGPMEGQVGLVFQTH
jgi:hypothetical protein